MWSIWISSHIEKIYLTLAVKCANNGPYIIRLCWMFAMQLAVAGTNEVMHATRNVDLVLLNRVFCFSGT
jgi:hypothetical protein